MRNELTLLRRIEDLEKLIMRQPEIGGVWKAWTPSFGANWSTTGTVNFTCKYATVGRITHITLHCDATGGSIALGAVDFIDGLPFTVLAGYGGSGNVVTGTLTQLGQFVFYPGTTKIYLSAFASMSNEFFISGFYGF